MAVQHGSHQAKKVVFHETAGVCQRIGGALFFELVAQEADIVLFQFPLLCWHARSLRGRPTRRPWRAGAESKVNFSPRMNTGPAERSSFWRKAPVSRGSGKNRPSP